jgi:ABC-type lipoprotein release transport system permease subunit
MWRATPLVVRTRIRRHRASIVGLALIFGTAGGAAIAALTGAARVESSYDRLLTSTNAPDLFVPATADAVVAQLGGTEIVQDIRSVRAINGPVLVTTDGRHLGPSTATPCQTGEHEVAVAIAPTRWGTEGWSPMLLHEGRPPDPNALEIAVPIGAAERVGLEVGDRLWLIATHCADERPVRLATPISVTVTGIGAGPLDVAAPGVEAVLDIAVATPMLLTALADDPAAGEDVDDIAAVWLADDARFGDLGPASALVPPQLTVQERAETVRSALRPDAMALRLLAVLVLVAGFTVLAQLLSRHLRETGTDGPLLAALGATPRERWVHGLLHAVVVGIGAGVVAVVVAIGLSSRVPRGIADAIEPRRVVVHPPTLVLGGFGLLVVIVLLAAAPAWKASRPPRPVRPRVDGLVDRLARFARLGPAASTGIQAAVPARRGASFAGVRQGLVALATALAVVAGVQTFSAGLARLRVDPRLVGWGWDAVSIVGEDAEAARQRLAGRAEVERVSAGAFFPIGQGWQLSSGNTFADVLPIAFETGHDAVSPVVVEGRAPQGPDEIIVARPVATRLGIGIGDAVNLITPSVADALGAELGLASPNGGQSARTSTVEVVGTGVHILDLESAIVMTADGAESLLALTEAEEEAFRKRLRADQIDEFEAAQAQYAYRPHALYVDLRGGRDDPATYAGLGGAWMVPRTAEELIAEWTSLDLSRPSRIPDVLGGLFAVVSVAVLAYIVSTGIRFRRSELAIHRALGMRRRQVYATVGWQASTTLVVAALVGIPLGVIAGRLAWMSYARGLNVVPASMTPVWWLVAVVVVGVIVANAVAIVPGWRAVRRPALADLRANDAVLPAGVR